MHISTIVKAARLGSAVCCRITGASQVVGHTSCSSVVAKELLDGLHRYRWEIRMILYAFQRLLSLHRMSLLSIWLRVGVYPLSCSEKKVDIAKDSFHLLRWSPVMAL